MSHYAVHIALPAEAEAEDIPELLDKRMEPYDENIEVAPYRKYISGEPQQHWAYETLVEEARKALPAQAGPVTPQATDHMTWETYVKLYNSQYASGGETPLAYDADKQSAYSMTTYNPNSKWDWWVVGGRWSGYWAAAGELAKELPSGPSSPDIIPARRARKDDERKGLRLDGGRKRYLDFETSLREAEHAAREEYELYTRHLKGHPPLRTFSEIQDAAVVAHPGIKEYPKEARQELMQQVRATYKDQPGFAWIDEYQFANKQLISMTEVIRAQRTREEAWMARAHWGALPVYAHIDLDGTWHAPGEMGWFGMSSEDEKQSLAYDETATKWLQGLPEDTWILTLDLHI